MGQLVGGGVPERRVVAEVGQGHLEPPRGGGAEHPLLHREQVGPQELLVGAVHDVVEALGGDEVERSGQLAVGVLEVSRCALRRRALGLVEEQPHPSCLVTSDRLVDEQLHGQPVVIGVPHDGLPRATGRHPDLGPGGGWSEDKPQREEGGRHPATVPQDAWPRRHDLRRSSASASSAPPDRRNRVQSGCGAAPNDS